MSTVNVNTVRTIADLLSAVVTAYNVSEWYKDNHMNTGDSLENINTIIIANAGEHSAFLTELVTPFIKNEKLDIDGILTIASRLREYVDAHAVIDWMNDNGLVNADTDDDANMFALYYSIKAETLKTVIDYAAA